MGLIGDELKFLEGPKKGWRNYRKLFTRVREIITV
jgi:hypothetical protein